MDTFSFNPESTNSSNPNHDVLSGFKSANTKNTSIQPGMSVKEISDVVAEKLMAVILEQFEATKVQFEAKEKNEKEK